MPLINMTIYGEYLYPAVGFFSTKRFFHHHCSHKDCNDDEKNVLLQSIDLLRIISSALVFTEAVVGILVNQKFIV